MIESVFDNSVNVSSNYTFHAPFKKYFPPIISPKSWSLKKQILQGIESDYFTYTGDKAEGLMLKLYRLNPKVGIRKSISAKDVKNQIYAAVQNNDMEWEKSVPEGVARIIYENWDIIKKFASGEDMTTRIAGYRIKNSPYKRKRRCRAIITCYSQYRTRNYTQRYRVAYSLRIQAGSAY